MQSIGRDKIECIVIGDGQADIAPMPGVTVLPSTASNAAQRSLAIAGLPSQRARSLRSDTDDYLLPRGLEHLLRAYASGTHGYVYGNAFIFDQQGTYQLRGAPDYVQGDMAKYNLHVITTLIPTAQVKAVGGMDERGDAWEDWRFHLRLAQHGICGYRTDQPIFVYRVYEGDHMTRFYPNKDTMEPVWKDYRNEQGVIPMAGCCGGDATAAQLAALGIQGAPAPEPIGVEGDRVRVKYVGTSKGTIPFDFGHKVIRLADTPKNRYADVTPQEAAWLAERIEIQIVPKLDPAVPPPEPLPEVSTPSAPVQVLRPARRSSWDSSRSCRAAVAQSRPYATLVKRLLATAGDVEWSLTCIGGDSERDVLLACSSAGAKVRHILDTSRLTHWQAMEAETRISLTQSATLIVNLANDLLPGQHWLARAVAAYAQTFGDGPGMVGFNDGHHQTEHSPHFLISRSLLNRYGGWPVWYDHNYGDTELCQRADRRRGVRQGAVGDAVPRPSGNLAVPMTRCTRRAARKPSRSAAVRTAEGSRMADNQELVITCLAGRHMASMGRA